LLFFLPLKILGYGNGRLGILILVAGAACWRVGPCDRSAKYRHYPHAFRHAEEQSTVSVISDHSRVVYADTLGCGHSRKKYGDAKCSNQSGEDKSGAHCWISYHPPWCSTLADEQRHAKSDQQTP
jgi:hypothetical protein